MSPARKRHNLMRRSKRMKRQHRGMEIMAAVHAKVIKRFLPYA